MSEKNHGTYIWGWDGKGRYESLVEFLEAGIFIETRRYFHPNGRVWRTERYEDGVLIRDETFGGNGALREMTSFDIGGDWIWERFISPKTGHARLSVNRDNFLFTGVPEDIICDLEDGRFDPKELFNIRWVGMREAVLEILGAAKVVPVLPFEAVDRLGPNRLLKIDWTDQWGEPRMDPWCFLELYCTTTGKVSYLRVSPGFGDIMSAIAWTFGMDKENYKLELET